MARDPRTPFNTSSMQLAPAMQTTPQPPKKSRGPGIALVTVLVLALIGAGGFFAYGFFFKNSGEGAGTSGRNESVNPGPVSTDLFVSFAQQVTVPDVDYYYGYELDDTTVQVALVGYTQSGREVELYHQSGAFDYRVSGGSIYIMTRGERNTVDLWSIDYSNSAESFTPELRTSLNEWPETFTVIADTLVYQMSSEDLRISEPILTLELTDNGSTQTLDSALGGLPLVKVWEDVSLQPLSTEHYLVVYIQEDGDYIINVTTGETRRIAHEYPTIENASSQNMVYHTHWAEGAGYSGLYEFYPDSGTSTFLGEQSNYVQACGMPDSVAEFNQGYVYLSGCGYGLSGPTSLSVMLVNRGQLSTLTTLEPSPQFRFTTILPISSDTVLLSGAWSSVGYSTRTINMQGDVIDSSDGGPTFYTNVQSPRYSGA